MTPANMGRRKFAAIGLLAGTCGLMTIVCFSGSGKATPGGARGSQNAFVMNSTGQLVRPVDYRSWVYVGTPVTPNDMNDGKAPFPEFHAVYIDPTSYEHWKNTGKFRDGTIIIKELVSVGGKKAASGKGYFMGEFIGLEATIKSSKHFAKEPGNWAYFSFTTPSGPLKTTAAAFPTANCNSCHSASADDDFVFTQYYPVLRAAKGVRTNPENLDTRKAAAGGGASESTGQAAGASTDAEWLPTAPTPAKNPGAIPTDKQALFEYLTARKYQSFQDKESKPHPGRGPHTKKKLPVRLFMDPTLAASLKAGKKSHPAGAGVVKEMYTQDNKLQGWAVMVKTQDAADGGKGWFWYEIASTTDGTKPVAMGNGVPGCINCHNSGDDMVMTDFPLQ